MHKPVKKILKILLIAVILILVAIPAVYINTAYGYLPIVMVILALAVSYICMTLVSNHIRISSEFTGGQCQRGKSVTIDLHVANTGMIMCPKAEANIFASDIFGNNDTQMRTALTLAPKADNEIGFDMDMPHIGVYDVGLDDMDIYDFFGIFKRRVNVDGRYQVFVLPRIFPVENIVNNEIVRDVAPKERRTAVAGGTDYMGIREYAVGDSMKNIHWKLSAKSMGYMTKVFESTRELDFTVLIDFASEKQESRETAMDIYDALIETGLSLIEEIARVHTSYYLLYADKQNVIKRTTPKGREDDITLIKDFAVLSEKASTEMHDAFSILEEDQKHSSRSSNIIVVTSRITEDLIQEIVMIKNQGRTPELYVIVPAALTARDRDDIKGRLIQLDENNIYFNFVTAGVN